MSSRGTPWSRPEVEATVASYFAMLERGLERSPFNKAAHRRELLPTLDDRSHGAVERKHQNISAILIEERVPYITGYKPLGNYQGLLRDIVLEQLRRREDLQRLMAREVERIPDEVRSQDILSAQVPPPPQRPGVTAASGSAAGVRRSGIDYLELEARNRALGLAGERFVLAFERERLIAARRERLAADIEHVSVTEGDGAGYDILSFEEDGRERLIEVKTTKFGEYTPFYASRNEVDTSRREAPIYSLYRVYDFGPSALLFARAGALDRSFELEPSTFVARVG